MSAKKKTNFFWPESSIYDDDDNDVGNFEEYSFFDGAFVFFAAAFCDISAEIDLSY